MSDYRANRPRFDALEEIRQNGDFSEFLIAAWGIIETLSNEAILKINKITSHDSRAKKLLALKVQSKLDIFKELGKISEDEYQTIIQFKKKRNYMFHEGAIFIRGLGQDDKDEIMDLGMHAADVMHNLNDRVSLNNGKRPSPDSELIKK